MTELLVGTKKGLFVLRESPAPIRDRTPRFAGDAVEVRDAGPRSERYRESVTSGFYGPRLMPRTTLRASGRN
jgi:hypothetical protein